MNGDQKNSSVEESRTKTLIGSIRDCHRWHDDNSGLADLLGYALEKEGFKGCVHPLNTIHAKLKAAFEDLQFVVTIGSFNAYDVKKQGLSTDGSHLRLVAAEDPPATEEGAP
jgi:hypothetical protein